MVRVYLALGSNLADPLQQINVAINSLDKLPMTRRIACSRFYRTKPLGPQDQPDYLNAVIVLETALSPESLLNHTQAIESQQGREHEEQRWGPRTLDLDIMLYGDLVINTPRLTVPHYDMKRREFMLYPLAEVEPDLVMPDGCSLSKLLSQVPPNGLTYWDV